MWGNSVKYKFCFCLWKTFLKCHLNVTNKYSNWCIPGVSTFCYPRSQVHPCWSFQKDKQLKINYTEYKLHQHTTKNNTLSINKRVVQLRAVHVSVFKGKSLNFQFYLWWGLVDVVWNKVAVTTDRLCQHLLACWQASFVNISLLLRFVVNEVTSYTGDCLLN